VVRLKNRVVVGEDNDTKPNRKKRNEACFGKKKKKHPDRGVKQLVPHMGTWGGGGGQDKQKKRGQAGRSKTGESTKLDNPTKSGNTVCNQKGGGERGIVSAPRLGPAGDHQKTPRRQRNCFKTATTKENRRKKNWGKTSGPGTDEKSGGVVKQQKNENSTKGTGEYGGNNLVGGSPFGLGDRVWSPGVFGTNWRVHWKKKKKCNWIWGEGGRTGGEQAAKTGSRAQVERCLSGGTGGGGVLGGGG